MGNIYSCNKGNIYLGKIYLEKIGNIYRGNKGTEGREWAESKWLRLRHRVAACFSSLPLSLDARACHPDHLFHPPSFLKE